MNIAIEEEASYFCEMIMKHDAALVPYDAIKHYEIEFSIICLRELKLVEEEGMRLLNEIKELV